MNNRLTTKAIHLTMIILATLLVLAIIPAHAQHAISVPHKLNETCTVMVNGQTTNVGLGGEFRVRNIPAGPELFRAYAICTKDRKTRYGRSTFFQLANRQVFYISELDMVWSDTPFPTTASISAIPEKPTLTGLGQTTQVRVTAQLSDSTKADVSLRECGSTYRTSNPNILTVNQNGVVTATDLGFAFITVTNEGATAVTRINVVQSDDQLTTVEGFVQFKDGTFLPGATVTILNQEGATAITGPDGRFIIRAVATTLGPLTVIAEVNLNGFVLKGSVAGLQPVPGGITDAGIITIQVGTVKVLGKITWSDGTMSGPGLTISNGELLIPAGSTVELLAGKLENNGTATWGGGTIRAQRGAVIENKQTGKFTITGNGVITHYQAVGNPPIFKNAGEVNPGVAAGILDITGDYLQTATGRLNIDIGGLAAGTEFDQLKMTGRTTLSGTLNIRLINGFVPSLGNSFEIMTFGSRSGNFTSINGLSIGNGRAFELQFGANNLRLVVVQQLTDAEKMKRLKKN